MDIKIREYRTEDAVAASEIWNQVVDDGVAFPQEEDLTRESGDAFFKSEVSPGHLSVLPFPRRFCPLSLQYRKRGSDFFADPVRNQWNISVSAADDTLESARKFF